MSDKIYKIGRFEDQLEATVSVASSEIIALFKKDPRYYIYKSVFSSVFFDHLIFFL